MPLAMTTADGVDLAALVTIGLFLAWGALRGAVRQALGLVAVAAGFAVASWLGPRLVHATKRVVTLSPDGTACAAWGAAFFATLVLCGIGIHSARGPLDRARIPHGMDPWFGGAVGFVKGVLLLSVATYAILGASVGEAGDGLGEALRASRTARAVVRFQSSLRPVLGLPARVAARVEAVNGEVRPTLKRAEETTSPPSDDLPPPSDPPALARPRSPR